MDLAADFNNIGVALHRLQRYQEAEEMFKGAVQVLLQSKGSMLLNQNCCCGNNNSNSNAPLFETLVQDDQIRTAASKIETQAVHHVEAVDFASNESIHSLSQGTSSWPTTMEVDGEANHRPSPSPPSIPPSSWPPSSSSSTAQGQVFPQDSTNLFPTQEGPSWDMSRPTSATSSSVNDAASHRQTMRDEFSVYMCLDAIQLDAAAAASTAPSSVTSSVAPFASAAAATLAPSTSTAAAAATVTAASGSSLLQDNVKINLNEHDHAIGRYDFETIVVLYNMALTLHCLDQLTLSCYIYDLADRVLRGQPMDKVRKDHVACKLAMAISNNLGQIFLKLGYLDIARAYVHRLADFLLSMDPPANAEQAKERLEYVLNIYWFDNPPAAAAA